MNQFLKPALLLLTISFTAITHCQQTLVTKTPTGITITCKDHMTELQVYSPVLSA